VLVLHIVLFLYNSFDDLGQFGRQAAQALAFGLQRALQVLFDLRR